MDGFAAKHPTPPFFGQRTELRRTSDKEIDRRLGFPWIRAERGFVREPKLVAFSEAIAGRILMISWLQ
jgi:hypothetical protein